MAMGKGAKIAIGCGIVAVLVVIAAIVGVIGLGMFAKHKIQGVTGDLQKTVELQKETAAMSFTPPSDGVIQEDELVRFLAIRKAVYPIYEAHKAEIEQHGKGDVAGFHDAMNAVALLNQLRNAKLQAQVDQHMGDDEYNFVMQAVYKSAWSEAFRESMGGKSASEVANEAIAQARRDVGNAQAEGNMPAEGQQALAATQQSLDAAEQQARATAAQFDIPPQNLALFKKYETEIKRYSMSGLEFVGL
jgi:hypothetical protein